MLSVRYKLPTTFLIRSKSVVETVLGTEQERKFGYTLTVNDMLMNNFRLFQDTTKRRIQFVMEPNNRRLFKSAMKNFETFTFRIRSLLNLRRKEREGRM